MFHRLKTTTSLAWYGIGGLLLAAVGLLFALLLSVVLLPLPRRVGAKNAVRQPLHESRLLI
jgi:uncharacterized membrane protein YgaE (UPF0421/DUF939 family)